MCKFFCDRCLEDLGGGKVSCPCAFNFSSEAVCAPLGPRPDIRGSGSSLRRPAELGRRGRSGVLGMAVRALAGAGGRTSASRKLRDSEGGFGRSNRGAEILAAKVQGTNRSQEHWSPLHQSGDLLKISSSLGAKHHTSRRWVVGHKILPTLLQDARTRRTKRSLLAQKVQHSSTNLCLALHPA